MDRHNRKKFVKMVKIIAGRQLGGHMGETCLRHQKDARLS